ncbi:hypothetical protein ES705_30745 [subsurface metagenome]
MTLEKAIEIHARTGDEFLHTDPDEIDEADRLLISAGKIIQWKRANHLYVLPRLLPGETKE